MQVNKIVLEFKNDRKRKKISTYRLSKEIGISNSSIGHIESLKQNPTLSTMMELSLGTGFDLPAALKRVFPYDGIESLIPNETSYSPTLEVITDKLKKVDEETLAMVNQIIEAIVKRYD